MRGKSADEGSYVDTRYGHVQTSYPRILYIFSDVLCFVFSGNWREKSNILDPLLEWGKTASFGADNQHRPQLIIIFNKTDKETFHDDFDDFKKTFEKWIADDLRKKDLLLYYSNPLVVSVPHMDFDGADEKVPSRVAKLREAIMESTQRIRTVRSEGKLLFTRRQLELYMRKVAGLFSKYPTAVFDIYKAMVADSALVGLTGYIVRFRQEVEIASPDGFVGKVGFHPDYWTSSKKFATSLMVLKSYVKQSMLLWISRNVDLTFVPSPTLPPDLRKALKDADDIIVGEMPCSTENIRGFECGTMKRAHKHYHSGVLSLLHAKATGARYSGDFCAHPDVVNAMEDQGSLVNLAESVFKRVSGSDVRKIRELVLGYRSERQGHSWHSWMKDFTSYQVCVICLLNLPTEILSCGHIICDKCAKEEAETSLHAPTRLARPTSLSCPVCQSNAKWYMKNLPPLAGCRILSLDGGGVRGIVELLSLKAIMAHLPGMHVEDLFDIVIGTSTGGIIALALTVRKKPDEEPKRLAAVINLFMSLAKEVFSKKQLNFGASFRWIATFCQYVGLYESKYKNDALLRLLEQHLGEQSLLQSCVGGPRVIITACDSEKEAAAAWFTSYNHPRSDTNESEIILSQLKRAHGEDNQKSISDLLRGRVDGGYLFRAMDVAAATSAAPTYLPLVYAGGRLWADGGLRFNGPPMIAIEEARRLWPERQVSALISLGCGKLKSSGEGSGETASKKPGVLNLLKLVVDIAFDADEKCNSAIRHLETLQPVYNSTSGPGLRLNPTIDKKCDLDDAVKMNELIEQTDKYLTSKDGKAVVGKVANLLFAALFHLHIESDEDLHAQNLNLRIRSCSALPQCLQEVLKETSDPFSVTVETSGAPPKSEFDWMRCTWDQDYMDLPFSLNDLPTTRPLSMVVNLHKRLSGTDNPAEKSPIPISGMPYVLKAD
ncbi:hypothetical protein KC19_1G107900 [Ceratodon purpureus]|nr:hypothetical protein KC19_1G107900 [Ceratodon purpureus]